MSKQAPKQKEYSINNNPNIDSWRKQDHCRENQQSNTKIGRINTRLKNGNTNIKATTPITRALHEQCHHDYSNDHGSEVNAKAALPKHNNMASLPGDPQADLLVQLHAECVAGLIENGYLRMNLLDFILYLTCMYSHDTSEYNYCLRGTITRQLLEQMLMPIRGITKQEKFL